MRRICAWSGAGIGFVGTCVLSMVLVQRPYGHDAASALCGLMVVVVVLGFVGGATGGKLVELLYDRLSGR